MKKKTILLICSPFLLGLAAAGSYAFYHYGVLSAVWQSDVTRYLTHSDEYQNWIQPGLERCGDAAFIFPSSGYIGFFWDISFKPGHRHEGIDIFSGKQSGVEPVYTVTDGYITRESTWKSTLIERVPDDPIHPGRQIWVYYTHMALSDGTSTIVEDFPTGTSELFVKAGTLLGYQGNFSGTADSPTGVHLHLSIVKDDGTGHYTNEARIRNTLDPSPYFNLPLNADSFPKRPVLCSTSQ
jgi:peptidoglycan LD-endopeptidase LytH